MAVLAATTGALAGTNASGSTPRCFGEAATIVARPGQPTNGTAGDDIIVGTPGADTIRGKGGNDKICSGAGNDIVYGGRGNDRINLGPGDDWAKGGRGNDRILGKGGNDTIRGNSGKDTLIGGRGKDSLRGGSGADVLKGGGGPDKLFGGPGADRLYGHRGADTLDGSSGKDRCQSGSGAGTFTRCELVSANSMQLLASLEVRPEDRTGYSRSLFSHWSDLDRDGCDTRQEVLAEESRVAVSTSDGCRVTTGSWLSRFDQTVMSDPSTLDIDHLVPLAEAWDSGASAWDSETRRQFANDQTDARSLIAVSASTNRAKGDRDPAQWLPPAVSYRCQYATDWVAVKTRWHLAVDAAEHATLKALLLTCSGTGLAVTAASIGEEAPEPDTGSDSGSGDTPPNPGDVKNCGDFGTYSEAKAWHDTYFPFYGDVAHLDGDGDGIPCEGLPGAP